MIWVYYVVVVVEGVSVSIHLGGRGRGLRVAQTQRQKGGLGTPLDDEARTSRLAFGFVLFLKIGG